MAFMPLWNITLPERVMKTFYNCLFQAECRFVILAEFLWYQKAVKLFIQMNALLPRVSGLFTVKFIIFIFNARMYVILGSIFSIHIYYYT